MTEVLITLMNAPRAVQRVVALGILALLLTVSGALVIGLASILTNKIDHVQELRTELFRLDQIIARKPPASFDESPPQPDGLFLPGGNISAMQAALQERVTSVSATSGATIASMSGLAQLDINGATYVGLRVDFDGDLGAVHEVIRQLEVSQPPLIIRKAAIRSNNTYSQGLPSEAIHLSAQVSVYGAVDPEQPIDRDETHP